MFFLSCLWVFPKMFTCVHVWFSCVPTLMFSLNWGTGSQKALEDSHHQWALIPFGIYPLNQSIPHSDESQSVHLQVLLVYALWTIHVVSMLLGSLLVVQLLTYTHTMCKNIYPLCAFHICQLCSWTCLLSSCIDFGTFNNKQTYKGLISINWPNHSMTRIQEQSM